MAEHRQKHPKPERINPPEPSPDIDSSETDSEIHLTHTKALLSDAPPPLDRKAILQLQALVGNRAVQRMLQQQTTNDIPPAGPQNLMREATQGSRSSVPYKSEMEHSFGQDFSDVQAYTGRESQMQALEAAAATQGDTIVFAGDSPDKELVAHELAHIVQSRQAGDAHPVQRKSLVSQPGDAAEREAETVALKAAAGEKVTVQAKPTATIHRTYASLGSTGKARVDSLAESTYAQKTEDLEFKMGSLITGEPAVREVVEKMLAMIKQMVDAWAKATGQTTFWGNVSDEFYEREFAFEASEKYYGAFQKTASSIKKVFTDKNQPIRKKLHLIYNSVRNNNLAKYLKMAAMELEQAAKGGGKKSQTIFESTKALEGGKNWSTAKPTELTVQSGFAKKSGLKDILEKEGSKRQKSFSEIGEREKWQDKSGGKIAVSAPDTFSDIHGWSKGVSEASKDRAGGQNTGLTLDEQDTLNVGDVEDLTSSEIRQLYKAKGQPVPKMTKSQKTKFKRDNDDSKIAWEQGREYYDVILNSEVDKEAAKFHAHLEAGISGSTDLMLHAAQNLALSDDDMKKLRLTMIGWMLSNRDHSFWEIMVAAENYGLPFVKDETRIGYEYEAPANFYPMDVNKIKNLLPEKQFPSYFMSMPYKNKLAGELDEPTKTKGDFAGELNTDGIPKAVTDKIDDRATVEMQQLNEIIKQAAASLKIDVSKGDETPQKRALIRRLKDNTAYAYLARKFPVHADFIVNALVTKHLGANALTGHHKTLPALDAEGLGDDRAAVTNTLVTDIGLPTTYLAGLPDYRIYDLQKFALVIKSQAAAFKNADPDGQSKMLDAWKANPLFQPIARSQGENWTNRVLNLLLTRFVLTKGERDEAAARITKIEQIADTQKESGVWFSWGSMGSLLPWEKATSIKDFSFLANVSSPQGPGLYVAKDAFRSQGYGNTPGHGVIAAIFTNVPTIKRGNKAQETEIGKITYGGGKMTFDDLFINDNHAEMLLWYGGGYARLTTNKGVKLTVDLSQVDAAILKAQYKKITDPVAKQNFKNQAQAYKVDVSTWDT